MMMMTTGLIPVRQAVEGAVLARAITMTTARVRRTCRALRKGPGKGREQTTGRGKGRGRGRETVERKVLLNEPQGEIISPVPLLCSCRSKCQRQTWTRRANWSGYI
jgi:hypothetical protein